MGGINLPLFLSSGCTECTCVCAGVCWDSQGAGAAVAVSQPGSDPGTPASSRAPSSRRHSTRHQTETKLQHFSSLA